MFAFIENTCSGSNSKPHILDSMENPPTLKECGGISARDKKKVLTQKLNQELD